MTFKRGNRRGGKMVRKIHGGKQWRPPKGLTKDAELLRFPLRTDTKKRGHVPSYSHGRPSGRIR